MTTSTQRQTTLNLTLAGSSEQIKLKSVEAYEAFSEHFMISVEALALAEVDLLANLGTPAAVECQLDGETLRYYHGIIVDGCFISETTSGLLYRFTLAPKIFFHEHGRNFRIFQDKSVIDIIKTVLDERSIDYRVAASGGTRQLAYCVQYGESDFAFVSRLLEEEGLYYCYDHKEDKHEMVIYDASSQHADLKPSTLEFNMRTGSVDITDSKVDILSQKKTYVQKWIEYASSGAEIQVTMRDFDFMAPNEPVETNKTEESEHNLETVEVYCWPGRYYDQGTGNTLAEVALQARRAQRLRFEGVSQYSGLEPGRLFELTDHPHGTYNRKYLIIGCRAVLADETYRSIDSDDSQSAGGKQTTVEFTAIREDVKFRAPQVTPRPMARGPETAKITGPAGEEIYVDQYGRVKVHFHWDRENQYDDTSSCWLRVSQTGGLGNIIHPRIGQEVLVDFIGGNPDRPIVVGRVYNDETMPHYALPDNKTRAVWRSKTHKKTSGVTHSGAKDLDTGKPGANEIMMEDKTGEEEFYIHAEKDLKIRVRNDETHHVGKDQEIKIMVNRDEDVGKNDTIHIGNDRTTTIDNDHTETVSNNQKITVRNNQTIDVTNKIAITAGMEIKLTCGASTITMTPSKVEVSSPQIEIKAMGTAKMESPMTEVKGMGMLTLQGGLVKIN